MRGINYMNIRGLNTPIEAPQTPDPSFATGFYYSRAQYLMAIGRPAAQVALYHPPKLLAVRSGGRYRDGQATTQLMEQQIDFDHIDHDTLASVCTLEGGRLKNLSGQVYLCRDRADFDRDPEERAGAPAGVCGGWRQGVLRRPHALDGCGQDVSASRGRRAPI